MLTRLELLLAFHYDPVTGIWTRLQAGGGVKIGTRADRPRSNRLHRCINHKKRRYFAHVLAWLYMTGEWPPQRLDHADTNGGNNKWSNLRLATQSQNIANAILRRDNTSGYKGVSWSRQRKKWCAYISINGKVKPLGRFEKLEDAVARRKVVAEKVFGEFARHA